MLTSTGGTKTALDAAGTDSMIRSDGCGGLRLNLSMNRGVELLVRAEDAERADEILSATPDTEVQGLVDFGSDS